MYIKNKYKRDKRIASQKEAKQLKALHNSIYKDSQRLSNILNLGKVFINNNIDLEYNKETFYHIISTISSDISPFPLSLASLSHGASLLEDHYNAVKKNIKDEKKDNNN